MRKRRREEEEEEEKEEEEEEEEEDGEEEEEEDDDDVRTREKKKKKKKKKLHSPPPTPINAYVPSPPKSSSNDKTASRTGACNLEVTKSYTSVSVSEGNLEANAADRAATTTTTSSVKRMVSGVTVKYGIFLVFTLEMICFFFCRGTVQPYDNNNTFLSAKFFASNDHTTVSADTSDWI